MPKNPPNLDTIPKVKGLTGYETNGNGITFLPEINKVVYCKIMNLKFEDGKTTSIKTKPKPVHKLIILGIYLYYLAMNAKNIKTVPIKEQEKKTGVDKNKIQKARTELKKMGLIEEVI